MSSPEDAAWQMSSQTQKIFGTVDKTEVMVEELSLVLLFLPL